MLSEVCCAGAAGEQTDQVWDGSTLPGINAAWEVLLGCPGRPEYSPYHEYRNRLLVSCSL